MIAPSGRDEGRRFVNGRGNFSWIGLAAESPVSFCGGANEPGLEPLESSLQGCVLGVLLDEGLLSSPPDLAVDGLSSGRISRVSGVTGRGLLGGRPFDMRQAPLLETRGGIGSGKSFSVCAGVCDDADTLDEVELRADFSGASLDSAGLGSRVCSVLDCLQSVCLHFYRERKTLTWRLSSEVPASGATDDALE